MKKSWKALAGVAVAAALVVAPLAVSAASAAPNNDPDHHGYVLALWKSNATGPKYPQTLVTSVATVTQTLEALHDFKLEACTNYTLDLYADNATTDALLESGTLSAAGTAAESWPGGHYFFWYSKTFKTRGCSTTPEDTLVTPPTPTWSDPCGPENASWTGPETTGIDWAYGTDGDGNLHITAVAKNGYVFPEDAQVDWSAADSNEDCDGVYPVPAQLNADATPASCDSAGTFDTSFLQRAEVGYQIGNALVAVDRSVEGQVTLTVRAKSGYTLTGLSADWTVSDDAKEATRTITLPAQLTGEECAAPQAVVAAPEAPTFTDVCGTEGDGYEVPGDSETVSYIVSDDEYPLVTVSAYPTVEGDSFAEGTVQDWSHTFTDEACPTPAADPSDPTLAATGGSGVSPLLPIGGAVLVLGGIALAVMRKVAKR